MFRIMENLQSVVFDRVLPRLIPSSNTSYIRSSLLFKYTFQYCLNAMRVSPTTTLLGNECWTSIDQGTLFLLSSLIHLPITLNLHP